MSPYQGTTDASRKYAIQSASDGKFDLLYARKAVEGHEAIGATTYSGREKPQPFDSPADAIAFAKANLSATDDDFAAHPGDA